MRKREYKKEKKSIAHTEKKPEGESTRKREKGKSQVAKTIEEDGFCQTFLSLPTVRWLYEKVNKKFEKYRQTPRSRSKYRGI